MKVITLGCSKNLVDSERLLAMLADAGFEAEHQSDDADETYTTDAETVVVNTCGFIGDAKEESVNEIMSQVAAKQDGRIKQLIVMGCLSERYRKELQTEIPEVDRFTANSTG